MEIKESVQYYPIEGEYRYMLDVMRSFKKGLTV